MSFYIMILVVLQRHICQKIPAKENTSYFYFIIEMSPLFPIPLGSLTKLASHLHNSFLILSFDYARVSCSTKS